MDLWVHDSFPLDIGSADLMTLSLPPLIWLESNKKPLAMTIKNTGKTRNKAYILYSIINKTYYFEVSLLLLMLKIQNA